MVKIRDFLHFNGKIAENCTRNLDCNNNNNEQTKTSRHKTSKIRFLRGVSLTYLRNEENGT